MRLRRAHESAVVALLSILFNSAVASAAVHRVVDYGARCDGTIWDTPYIQAAFDAAQPGDSVEFPAGSCYILTNIALNSKTNVTVYGAGMDSTIIYAGDQYNSTFQILGGSGVTVRDLQVFSYNSDGRGGNDQAESNFFASAASNVSFVRVKAQRARTVGIFFKGVSGGGVWDSVILDTWADGIHATFGSTGLTVSNNTAQNTGDDSFACVAYGGDPSTSSNVGFYGNRSYYSQSSGVTVAGCEYVNVHSNTIYRSAHIGIRVEVSSFWNTRSWNEVDVRWNTIEEAGCCKFGRAWPSIATFAEVLEGANAHVRENTIYHPQATIAIEVYGYPSGTVRDSQFEYNSITDYFGDTYCVVVYGSTFNISVFSNWLNGAVCPS